MTTLRRVGTAAALLLLLPLFLSCGGGDGGSPSPTPTNVVVAPGADTLISIGETQAFTATVLDANGDPIDGAAVTWSSDAPSVVTINAASGVATAVANGSAHVKATAGALEGTANVFVTQIVASVTVTPGNVAFTSVGDTARFTAVAKDAGNTVVAGVQILWSVSDNTVATIDTLGLAKAKGPGTALVSAQAQTRAGFAAIGVDPTVTQIAILSAPPTGTAGEPLSTALQVELRDARGNRAMNSSLVVTVAPGGDAWGTPLHGTAFMLADQGRATFTNLWFEKAGVDRLRVTVGALPVDSTSLVLVEAGPPARVHVSGVPDTVIAGAATGLTAALVDRFGNPVGSFNGEVQALALHAGTPTPLQGDSIVNAFNGVATFPAMFLTTADFSYRFTATLPGAAIARDTTPVFTVRHGTAHHVFVTLQGGIQAPRGHFGDSTFFELKDQFGNVIIDTTLQIGLGVTDWNYFSPAPYGQQIDGPATVPFSAGHAAVALGVRRPGVVRMIYSIAGGAADTSGPLGVYLPQVNTGSMTVTDLTTCVWVIFCSGSNAYGLLGVDSTIVPRDSLFVLADSGGFPLPQIGGGRHICAQYIDSISGDRRLGCRGDNSDGQLGGGSVGGASTVMVFGPWYASMGAVSLGDSHSCAKTDLGTYCWGKNDVGQLGTGSAGASTGTPTLVAGGHTFNRLSGGGRHTCGVDSDGHGWCWGANDRGQLGDSGVSGAFSATPVAVFGDYTWADIQAGDDFTCGLRTSPFEMLCWGNNDRLQLGTATDSMRTIPGLVGPAPDSVTLVQSAGPIVAGNGFACSSLIRGGSFLTTQCWGANDHGQLGRGTTSVAELPGYVDGSQAPGFNGMTLMVAGANHVCGKDSGVGPILICWGRNDKGQLGVGHTQDVLVPVIVQQQY